MRQHNNQHNRKGEEEEKKEVGKEGHGTHHRPLLRSRRWMRSSWRDDDLALSLTAVLPFFQHGRLIRRVPPRGCVDVDRKDLGAIDAARALGLLVLEDVGHLLHVLAVEALHFPLLPGEGNLLDWEGRK